MILAIDVGNTNIVVGVVDDSGVSFVERISTNRTKTELEYAIDIKTILDIHHIDKATLHGSIISSVVPQLTNILKLSVHKILHKEPLVLGPGVKTGLNIAIDNPAEMGADRVADAVAAISEYEVPLVIVDMGTATTISVVDENKRFVGGLIMPGVRVSLDALTSRASQLAGISIDEPKNIIGKNTIECMKSGIIYGNASAIDGVVAKINEEMETSIKSVIATGGMSHNIVPHCSCNISIDENLLLKGLWIIYKKNQ